MKGYDVLVVLAVVLPGCVAFNKAFGGIGALDPNRGKYERERQLLNILLFRVRFHKGLNDQLLPLERRLAICEVADRAVCEVARQS